MQDVAGLAGAYRREETGDVMQNATVRLYRSLSEKDTPLRQVVDFFRLAALHIRRELCRPGPAL